MDQGPLVSEKIEAGTEFIFRLNEYVPIRIAFWVKDEGRWNLYLASDKNNDSTKKPDYADLSRVAREMDNPNLNQFQVTLIDSDDPLARAVSDIHQRYKAHVPTRVRDQVFGGRYVEEVYLYPPLSEGANAKKWLGVWVEVWPELSPQGAYRVEFCPHEAARVVPWPGGPHRIPRPAGVLVKDGQAIEYRPPEEPIPHLTQSDYEKKAVEAVEQVVTP